MSDKKPSDFNDRFTELLDQKIPPGDKSMFWRLGQVYESTDISISTLRKYYVAPDDDEELMLNSRNRVHMPSVKYIKKLAEYFEVSEDYLSGASEVVRDDTAAALLSNPIRDSGLTQEIIDALRRIKELPDADIYYAGLHKLLEDVAGEIDSNGKHDPTRKPYHLLYLIGKYFSDLYGRSIAVVNPDDISQALDLVNLKGTTVPTLQTYLKRIIDGSTYTVVDLDEKHLPDIQKELKALRDNINKENMNVYSAIAKELKKSKTGKIVFEYNGIPVEIALTEPTK